MSQQLSVLVVDDDDDVRHMLSMLLRKNNYRVTTAENGEEAIKELLSAHYDLMLSDVRMPKMSGHALLKEVKSRDIDTTVIMMSAYGDLDTALMAIKEGAYDYISKPFKRDEVLLTLQKAEEREQLRRENAALRAAQGAQGSFDNIVAQSDAMKRVFAVVRKVAAYKTTVLLHGESGTGKELIARGIHTHSDRDQKPWVAVNCGAIPETLLESELFGHVKGSFTDANKDKDGLFLQAHGGTIFLDEIAELPLSLQVKLLRVLQEGEVRRVGDTKNIKIDVRVIAASAKSLEEMVKAGTFREDLFYRLNVMPIELPPLRRRAGDIKLLVEHFIVQHNRKLGTKLKGINPDALKVLVSYPWPGNIRELENAIEMSMVLSEGDTIDIDALPPRFQAAKSNLSALVERDDLSIKKATRELEEILIRRALERTKGNRTRASELLEISHRALLYKIKDYGLQTVGQE